MPHNPFGSLTLDGADDYGYVSHHADYNFTGDSFSIDISFKGSSAGPLINKFASSVGWKIETTAGGAVQVILSATALSGGSNVNDDSWHQVQLCVDREAETAYLFVDGSLVASQDISSLGLLNTSADIIFGANEGIDSYYTGSIQEIRISTKCRNVDDYPLPVFQYPDDAWTILLLHFNGGLGGIAYDMSEKRHQATLSGSPTWAEGALVASPVTIAREQVWLVLDEDTDLANYMSRYNGTKWRFRDGDALAGDVTAEDTPALMVVSGDVSPPERETNTFHTILAPIIVEGYLYHQGIAEVEQFWWLIVEALWSRFGSGTTAGKLEHKHIQDIELSGPDFYVGPADEEASSLFSWFTATFIIRIRRALTP